MSICWWLFPDTPVSLCIFEKSPDLTKSANPGNEDTNMTVWKNSRYRGRRGRIYPMARPYRKGSELPEALIRRYTGS